MGIPAILAYATEEARYTAHGCESENCPQSPLSKEMAKLVRQLTNCAVYIGKGEDRFNKYWQARQAEALAKGFSVELISLLYAIGVSAGERCLTFAECLV